jgi:hypothetical protein
MTRRHFRALAALVADVQANGGSIGAEALAHRLADLCKAESPRFDRQRFLAEALPRVWRGGRWQVIDRRS